MRTNWTVAAVAASAAAGIALAFTGVTSAGADGINVVTPGPSPFTVPTGVCSVNVNALGAPGGAALGDGAGAGGQAGGTIRVTPGEQLGVNVGGQGTNTVNASTSGGAGGVNGGGAGGSGGHGFVGAGGGGASDVRQAAGGPGCVPPCQTVAAPTRPGSTLGDRVIVAGGGGGSGNGPALSQAGAGGATNSGTPSGAGGTGTAGTAGTGGGGGGGGAPGGGGGGGGGGSSYVAPTVSNPTMTPGVNAADPTQATTVNGSVSLSFTSAAQPACAIVAAALLTG